MEQADSKSMHPIVKRQQLRVSHCQGGTTLAIPENSLLIPPTLVKALGYARNFCSKALFLSYFLKTKRGTGQAGIWPAYPSVKRKTLSVPQHHIYTH